MSLRIVAATLILAGASSALAVADPWPGFRGPTGQGHSKEIRLPVRWSAAEGVLWKTPVDGAAWSSPIVWGGRVFVTTARDQGRACHLIALDRRTGAVLWDTLVFTQQLKRKEDRNSYASPTPVTDGARVFAVFGDGSFVAVDAASGAVVWANRDFPFYSQHGLGSSLVLYRDLLIHARDGSSEGPDKGVGWQTPWEEAFVVALVARLGGRDVLLSPAGDVIQAFDPLSGKRLWTVPSAGEGVVPSPVVAGQMVVTVSGFGAPAVRAVTGAAAPAVAWEQTKGVPMLASPVVVDDAVYVVTDAGVLSALDAATGQQRWQQRLEGTFSASPVAADGKLYLLSDSCDTWVVAPGPAYALLSRNRLEGRCHASMAVSGGLLFIRTDSTLYAIGTQPR
jgi:outer membrane protein assembly factor BamB